jgi:protein-S-isoprenylcysteine O-methyltransferase Ste14
MLSKWARFRPARRRSLVIAEDRSENPDEGSAAPDASGGLPFPPAIYLAGLGLAYVAHLAWPAAIAPDAFVGIGRVIGGVFVALWLIVGIWAMVSFWQIGTTPLPTRPTLALAIRGSYRFTRNPMYLGLAFMQVGVAFLMNSAWPLATLLLVLWIVRYAVIKREERYLEAKFGAEYLCYKAKVRRWL